jgi:hypothetical protein
MAVMGKIFTMVIITELFKAFTGETITLKAKIHATYADTTVINFTVIMKAVGSTALADSKFIKPGTGSTEDAAGGC